MMDSKALTRTCNPI